MKRSRLAIALSTSSLLLANYSLLAGCPLNEAVLAPNMAQERPVAYMDSSSQAVSPSAALATAQQMAWEASLLVQRPPHSVQTWQQAKVTWRHAIRLLEKIPASSSLYAQAQQKIIDYQKKYAVVNQRLALEETGAEAFEQAQTAAWQAALTVQKPPQSLKVWQRAQEKWQEAIALLESVPPMTTVAAPAKAKLLEYRDRQRVIDQRIQTEVKAQATLQQFSALADRLYALQVKVLKGQSVEPIGIGYENYRQLVQPLRDRMRELNRQPEGTRHPIYRELADAIADYEFVIDIWQAYLEVRQKNSWYLQEDDLFNQLIPLSKIDSERLLNQYEVKLYQGTKQPKVPLKFTAWAIWDQAGKRIHVAQKKNNEIN
jgi:hypothetical protein